MSEAPGALRPVTVAKPWGQEVWYSGMETRGESGVRTLTGLVPLSQYLDERGRNAPVILLKALQATAGDLYLEVHETKSEVYVVDRIDADGSPVARTVVPEVSRPAGRREVSGRRCGGPLRQGRGRGGGDRCRPVVHESRRSSAPAMRSRFLCECRIRLLKGVHVIEFQTPVFERRILAASQPVVTQQGLGCRRGGCRDGPVGAVRRSEALEERGSLRSSPRTPDFTGHPPPDCEPKRHLRCVSLVGGMGGSRYDPLSANVATGSRTAFLAPATAELVTAGWHRGRGPCRLGGVTARRVFVFKWNALGRGMPMSNEEHELIVEQIQIGPMANFTYIVGSRSTREVAVVDPAWDIDGLLNHLAEARLHADRRAGHPLPPGPHRRRHGRAQHRRRHRTSRQEPGEGVRAPGRGGRASSG